MKIVLYDYGIDMWRDEFFYSVIRNVDWIKTRMIYDRVVFSSRRLRR